MIPRFDLQLPWLKANYVDSAAVSLCVFPRTICIRKIEVTVWDIIRFRNYKYECSIVDNESCSGKSLHIYLRDEKRNSFV